MSPASAAAPDAVVSPASRPLSRILLVLATTAWAAAVLTLLLARPDGLAVSSDAAAPALPLWQVFLPPVLGIVLVLALPPRRTDQPAVVGRPRAFARSTWFLLATAVAIIGLGLTPVSDVDFVLLKGLLLLIVPALVLRFAWRGGVEVLRSPGAWRWWAPLVVVVAWTWVGYAAPWVRGTDFSGVDPVFLIVGAVVTAITAGVGEELFYRRWLQTRLEAALGPATAIMAASVLFGLMHFGTHGAADLPMDAVVIVAVQGTSGVFLGLLWWRYRSIAVNIVVHLIMNGWHVAGHLLSLL